VPAASLDKSTTLASDLDALVIPARAESAFEIKVGPFLNGARLRARTMVYSQFRTDEALVDPAPVSFKILVDGKERQSLGSEYVREVKGHEHPYDQLMRTLELPLDEAVGREATLRFETTRAGASIPEGAIPAEPAWWELVVLQPVEIERQIASPARPNLLVLVVDTLAAKRMSLHGYARDTTPHLKAFAAQGTLCEAAVAPSSWTLPSTASLLSGLPPNTHGVLGDTRSYLMDGLQTWPELLRAKGLDGAAFVANPLIAEANNFQQGFGHWDQANEARAAELNQRLLTWVDGQQPECRWFAYVHYMDPHAPYGAPGDERERFTAGYREKGDFSGLLPSLVQEGKLELDARGQQHVIDLYDAEVAYFDRCFGELLDELQHRGLLDKTTIVLTADHGEELFEHGRLGHGYSLYEELLWVPLVFVGPGIKAGERRDAPLGISSLAATLALWGGAEPVTGMAPPLVGPAPKPERPAGEPIFSAVRTSLFIPQDSPPRTLVSARDAQGRKVIVELGEEGLAVGIERYNLAGDPKEQAPLDPAALTDAEREAYERLVGRIEAWARETAQARLPEPQPVNDEIGEALRQLGYTGGQKQ
jgi:arylsulfatase